MESSFNEYDVVVLLVILASSLLSLLRGFIREFFSLFAWLGAGLITFLYFSKAATLLGGYFESKTAAKIIAIVGIYIVSLILIHIVNVIILDFAREVRLGMIDRTLGLAFGFVRGLIIVSIIHFAIMTKAEGENRPEPSWLTEAKTYNLTAFGAGILQNGAGNLKSIVDDYIPSTHPSKVDANALSRKLTPFFAEALKDAEYSDSERNQVFRKVIRGLPEQDKEKLAKKLADMGEKPDDEDISETTLEMLVLYKKADQTNLIKKDNQLNDDEKPILDDAIKGLQKKVIKDAPDTTKDEDLDIDLPKVVK